MTLHDRNNQQICQSKSDLNRYYFWKKYGRDALDNNELLLFYIESGGAENFANLLKKEEKWDFINAFCLSSFKVDMFIGRSLNTCHFPSAFKLNDLCITANFIHRLAIFYSLYLSLFQSNQKWVVCLPFR